MILAYYFIKVTVKIYWFNNKDEWLLHFASQQLIILTLQLPAWLSATAVYNWATRLHEVRHRNIVRELQSQFLPTHCPPVSHLPHSYADLGAFESLLKPQNAAARPKFKHHPTGPSHDKQICRRWNTKRLRNNF